MNDENQVFKTSLDKITDSISKEIGNVRQYAPFTSRSNIVRQPFDGRPLDDENRTPKNEDVPRAGELSSQVFNNLTVKIVSEIQESSETKITEITNLRSHIAARIDAFKAAIDKENDDIEILAKKHQEKINAMAEKVKKEVEEDTKQMIALSNRLRDFADTVNSANEKFFQE
jgi:hypothetical protein